VRASCMQVLRTSLQQKLPTYYKHMHISHCRCISEVRLNLKRLLRKFADR
jgi:hypothetical protein